MGNGEFIIAGHPSVVRDQLLEFHKEAGGSVS